MIIRASLRRKACLCAPPAGLRGLLHRVELTALEHDEHVAEWVRLADKLSQVATVSRGGRGNEGGVRAAARELGIDKDEAHRAVKVDAIAPAAKAAACATGATGAPP